MKESEVQKNIMGYLRANKWYCQKIQSGMLNYTYGDKKSIVKLADNGTPDIMACINGKFVGIEVKKDERTTKKWLKVVEDYKAGKVIAKSNMSILNQYQAAQEIGRAGGHYLLVFSTTSLENDLKALKLIE